MDALTESPPMGRVLGIDPGLNVTGYGVIDFCQGTAAALVEAGVVRTRARGTLPERLAQLHAGIAEVIAAFAPQVMALEQLYTHYQRPRTATLMGHARGVICLAAAQAGLSVFPYPATQVKRLLTGSGRAAKAQVQQAVGSELRLATPAEPHDVADALAVALCHGFVHHRRNRLFAGGLPQRRSS